MVIGSRVLLNGVSVTVLGIAPREFRGVDPFIDIDFWIPITSWATIRPREAKTFVDRNNREFDVIGRLQPNVSIEQAQAELETLAHNLELAFPSTNRQCSVVVRSLRKDLSKEPFIMLAIVALILVTACGNVANLLLARAEKRRHEIAVRLALGASRYRILRQLLTECILLGVFGTAIALLFAWWLIALLPSVVIPPSTHRTGYQFLLDGRVVTYTLLTSMITVLVFGLIPGVRASRLDLMTVLKSDSGATFSGARAPLRNLVVICQVTLSVVVLCCSALLVKTFLVGLNLDLGFQRKDMLIVPTYTPYKPEQAHAFFGDLVERVQTLPDVKQVTLAAHPPMSLSEGGTSIRVSIPGYFAPDGATKFSIKDLVVAPNYFHVFGIRFLQGRDFTQQDTGVSTKVAIINETMVRRFWPDEDPIGKTIQVHGNESNDDREVVGVVRDSKINYPDEPPEPYIYLPLSQTNQNSMSLIIEAAGDPLVFAAPVKAQIKALDKTVRVYDVWTMRNLLRYHFFDREESATVVGILGIIGLILTEIGLYGIVSYSVTRRRHEIGLRMALGASSSDVLSLVLLHGLRLTVSGIASGLLLATATTPFLARMLHGSNPRDPATLIGVAILIVITSLVSSYFAARKGSRLKPMEALRHE